MKKGNGDEVLTVLRQQVEYASRGLVLGDLPPTCLVRLAIPAEDEAAKSPPTPKVELSENEELEMEKGGLASRLVVDLTGRTTGRKSNVVLIQNQQVEFPDAEFRLFLRLCV